MASPAIDDLSAVSTYDGDSDYGSEFSPEEEEIVSQLLSVQSIDIEDNPIGDDLDQNDAQQALHVPLVFGREQKSPLCQAARAAEEIAEHITQTFKSRGYYPDRMSSFHRL